MTEGGVRFQRAPEPGVDHVGTNRGAGIMDKDPSVVHAGTQTGHGYGQHGGGGGGNTGNGSTILGKTRSSLSTAAVTNRRSGAGGSTGAGAGTGTGTGGREGISHSSHAASASGSTTNNFSTTAPNAAAGGSSSSSSINPRRAAKIRHRSSSNAAAAAAAAAIIGGIPNYNHHPHQGHHHHHHHHNQTQTGRRSGVLSPISHPPPPPPATTTTAHAATSTGAAGAGFTFPINGTNSNANYDFAPGNQTAATNHTYSNHIGGRQTPGTITPLEMDPPVLSFWGTDPVPLPSRFARIKRKLVSGHEAELSRSWAELIEALQAEVRHIEELGPHLIPSIQFSEIEDTSQSARFSRDLKRYGVGVVRGVVPKSDTESYVRETVEFLGEKKNFKPSSVQDPTCFDFFWTPAQVRARAHPNVLSAQRFMMGLWEINADDKVATKFPITYADRIRIHGLPGSKTAPAGGANSSKNDEMDTSEDGPGGSSSKPKQPPMPAKSADDWLNAIQSTTIIAQVDNGSLERWEPDGYQRSGTYDRVFKGEWQAYDPWECAGRVSTSTDLYNGYGACSIFRMFQGLLALSPIEPGMVRLLPSPKLLTAYFLLRPFFSPRTPCPESREGPEWEAYLHPDNWALDREQNTIIHGAVPGHAQRVTELWHPHLHLRRSLITLPTLQTGDYIFWHPDLAYHITSDGTGLRSDNGVFAPDDVRMLVYLPAAPLTQTGALYLARQRKQFLRGQPGPDFDSMGSGLGSEGQVGRLGKEDIAEIGGPAALQSMGLAPYEVGSSTPTSADGGAENVTAGSSSPSAAAAAAVSLGANNGNKPVSAGKDVEMDDADGAETKSVKSTTSSSHGEAEVVRLANTILFPDQCGMGFPHKEANGQGAATSGSGGRGRGGSGGSSGSGMKPATTNPIMSPTTRLEMKEASTSTST